MERRDSPPAEREALLRVHPARHLLAIEELAAAGGGQIDADTVVSAGSWTAALHAAGGAIELVDLLVSGQAPAAASAHRPPGHHCETERPMGFCLLSNVAIAARHAVQHHGLERVLILDWDVHHGNGTQQVLYDDPSVLFTSIHQSPLYPGTGGIDEVGIGAGTGYTVNLPVPAGAGDAEFVSLARDVVAQLIASWAPQLVLVSAGYDAHAADPLASCQVSDAGFAAMASEVRRAAEAVGAPVGIVLEGGYNVDALARSFAGTLEALSAPAVAAPSDLPEHPLAVAARARLRDRWPALG